MGCYAQQGFKESVVALGYKGELIKNYFLNYYQLQGNLAADLGKGEVDVHAVLRRSSSALPPPCSISNNACTCFQAPYPFAHPGARNASTVFPTSPIVRRKSPNRDRPANGVRVSPVMANLKGGAVFSITVSPCRCA